MPRILHTSDWHLGAIFHGVDRAADELAAIDALVRLCSERAVDAVIIAGDVFDTANPGAAEVKRWYDAVLRLVREGGVGSVVAIGGNHDSGARLDGPRELLAACQVTVRGTLPLDAAPADCLVPLLDRAGKPFALCAAIPYLRETDLRMPPGDAAISVRQAAAMQERCAGIRAAALERAAGAPLVVTAHAFARGGSVDGSERAVFGQVDAVGSLGQVDAACLVDGAAYAAFGHLHRPQRVGGREHWRYCGSLLPSSFNGTPGGAVLATITGPGPATVETLALPAFRRYCELAGSPDELRAAISALPAAPPGEGEPLLLARVRLAGERHGVAAEVAAWARERGWLAVRVLREAVQTAAPGAIAPVPIEELRPLDVFRAAHRAGFGGNEPSGELLAAFAGLLEDERAGRAE